MLGSISRGCHVRQVATNYVLHYVAGIKSPRSLFQMPEGSLTRGTPRALTPRVDPSRQVPRAIGCDLVEVV